MSTVKEEAQKHITNMLDTMNSLNRLWGENIDAYNDILVRMYPFQKSFDEICTDVEVWLESIPTDPVVAICATCGTANTNPRNGFCMNDHDDWLEAADFFIKEHEEVVERAMKTTGYSREELKALIHRTKP